MSRVAIPPTGGGDGISSTMSFEVEEGIRLHARA